MYTKEELLIFSYINSNYDISIQNQINKIFKLTLDEKINFIEADIKLKKYLLEKYFTEKNINSLLKIFSNDSLYFYKKEIESALALCIKEQIKIYYYDHENFPKSLNRIKNPPFVIFVKGKLPNDEELKSSFALVGTRKTNIEGENFTKDIALYLNKNNFYNISGLALGIDTIGHENSLSRTGAILGQGLADKIYPKENITLVDKILINNGFLLSELFPTTQINIFNLIKRNRLQSALTSGIIIAQTDIKGGTVNTFKFAREQGKKIFISDINEKFIKKYKKDLIVIKNSTDFKEKLNNLYIQKKLFL